MDRKQPPDSWYSTEEAAAYLEVSATFLRGECRRLKVKHQEIGRRYRFLKAWLDAWRESHTKGGEAGAEAVFDGIAGG